MMCGCGQSGDGLLAAGQRGQQEGSPHVSDPISAAAEIFRPAVRDVLLAYYRLGIVNVARIGVVPSRVCAIVAE